jgi:hypothetical protein
MCVKRLGRLFIVCLTRKPFNLSEKLSLEISFQLRVWKKTYYRTTKEAVVEFWMGEYFDKIPDYMPDRDTIHLPTWMTQKWLHKEYLEIMEALPEGTFDPLFSNTNY